MKRNDDRKLLVLWSKIIREEAGNKCELCGRQGTLNAHHFFGKKSRATRYWIPNGICLCYSCHTGSVFSAHESPSWFEKEMLKIRGDLWLKDLTRRWNETKKNLKYLDIIDYLNGETNDY